MIIFKDFEYNLTKYDGKQVLRAPLLGDITHRSTLKFIITVSPYEIVSQIHSNEFSHIIIIIETQLVDNQCKT